MKSIEALNKYIAGHIQGVFSVSDMKVLKREIEKLQPGQVYVEIGVDEGRSFRTAHEYAKEGVIKIGIDINDIVPFKWEGGRSIGRAPFMQQEGIVGLEKTGFYVHGDANVFAELFDRPFVDLLLVDGFHGYEDVKKNMVAWEHLVVDGGTIIFHDYIDANSKGVREWVDKQYKDFEVPHPRVAIVRK